MKWIFIDTRENMKKCNTIDNPVKCDRELLSVSNKVNKVAIYCNEFTVSKETMASLVKNENCVIGTGMV